MRILLAALLFLSPSISRPADGFEDAMRLYEKGEFKKAEKLLVILSRSTPDDPKIRLWLGKTYLKNRQWDKAVREMEKAVGIEPSNAHYRLWLGRACGSLADHTFPLFAMGKAGRVIKEFEAASKLAPKDLDVRFDMLEFYLQAPAIVGGGDDKAKAEIETIASLDPKKGYIARAMMHQDKKKYDLAKKELIQATLDYPDYVAGYFDLAEFLLDQKDFEGSLKYSKKAMELNNSKRARLISAAARIRLRVNLEEAEGWLQELVSGSLGEGDPSFEQAYYWLGECHLATGNRTKAREALKSALVYDPDYEPAKKAISKLR